VRHPHVRRGEALLVQRGFAGAGVMTACLQSKVCRRVVSVRLMVRWLVFGSF
jgi:hypothetical protein